MKLWRMSSVLGATLMLSSCAVLSIHHGGKVNGVPFFVRTADCRHELTWLEPIYTLTLQSVSSKDGKETATAVGVAEFSLSDYTASQQDIASLKGAIVNGQDSAAILAMWTAIQAHGYNPLANANPKPDNIVLVANVNKVETAVDYRDPYYFNSRRPLIGTAKVDIKLASDGTMTEGSGEIESKTLQSFLDLLPIKELISTAAGIGAKGGGPPPVVALTYRLQVESRAIKHTHYRYYLMNPRTTEPPCPALAAVSFGEPGYNRERADEGVSKAEKEDTKNTVKVKGEISLPEKDKEK